MDWDSRLGAAEKNVRDTLERALAAIAGSPLADGDGTADDPGRSPVDTLASALGSHRDALAALERVAWEWSAAGCPPRRPPPTAHADATSREPTAGARVE